MNPRDLKWDMPKWDRAREDRVFAAASQERSKRASRKKMRLPISAAIAVGVCLLVLRPIAAQPAASTEEASDREDNQSTAALAMFDSGLRAD